MRRAQARHRRRLMLLKVWALSISLIQRTWSRGAVGRASGRGRIRASRFSSSALLHRREDSSVPGMRRWWRNLTSSVCGIRRRTRLFRSISWWRRGRRLVTELPWRRRSLWRPSRSVRGGEAAVVMGLERWRRVVGRRRRRRSPALVVGVLHGHSEQGLTSPDLSLRRLLSPPLVPTTHQERRVWSSGQRCGERLVGVEGRAFLQRIPKDGGSVIWESTWQRIVM